MLAAAMGILRLLMDEARREHLDTGPDQVVAS